MFIDFLTKEEQNIYLSLAIEIIKVDGKVDDKELKKIKSITQQISHSKEPISNKDYDLSTLNNSLSSKKIILTELIGICYIDGDYCEKEKEFIKELAIKINIIDSLEEIEEWVLCQVKQVIKGFDLINKD
ncbi:TerB family tellurite resistance protein [Tenacibaculum finnmarkense]|uniref:TerB family tellurite resistance protein n=1 Tax=Tenacibaculum finnmarkense TaxID=2781243 RepID=UPI001EFA5A86|nr:TerB family tellurite resistance protein [Tenacibaculum finnmarkense]MCG8883055.1 TerB family tellurite resistance protein [Tenacibaculum finnmarkense]